MWSELAAKPIILSEPSDHPTIRTVARLLIKNGELGPNTQSFAYRRLANEWDLEAHEVDHLIELQVDNDRELVSTQLKRKGMM